MGGPTPRLLLNCCGIFDVLTFDPTTSNPMAAMAHYQQEDLIALGKIVLGKKNISICLILSSSVLISSSFSSVRNIFKNRILFTDLFVLAVFI
jgi:hypothetical protein